jgi:hypothetical protein
VRGLALAFAGFLVVAFWFNGTLGSGYAADPRISNSPISITMSK